VHAEEPEQCQPSSPDTKKERDAFGKSWGEEVASRRIGTDGCASPERGTIRQRGALIRIKGLSHEWGGPGKQKEPFRSSYADGRDW